MKVSPTCVCSKRRAASRPGSTRSSTVGPPGSDARCAARKRRSVAVSVRANLDSCRRREGHALGPISESVAILQQRHARARDPHRTAETVPLGHPHRRVEPQADILRGEGWASNTRAPSVIAARLTMAGEGKRLRSRGWAVTVRPEARANGLPAGKICARRVVPTLPGPRISARTAFPRIANDSPFSP